MSRCIWAGDKALYVCHACRTPQFLSSLATNRMRGVGLILDTVLEACGAEPCTVKHKPVRLLGGAVVLRECV